MRTSKEAGWCYDVLSNDLRRWVYGDGEPMHYAPYGVNPDCTAIDLSDLESGEMIRVMAQRREELMASGRARNPDVFR